MPNIIEIAEHMYKHYSKMNRAWLFFSSHPVHVYFVDVQFSFFVYLEHFYHYALTTILSLRPRQIFAIVKFYCRLN